MVEKSDEKTRRLKAIIHGAVQGVGFRPFIYRLATEMHLHGWVSNTPQGVLIEVEGNQLILNSFIARVHSEKPPLSSIHSCETSFLDPLGFDDFEIRKSTAIGSTTALVVPDIATCPDCLKEIFDVNNRRYLYPFTNCTNCGPRFTIIQSLPYDRGNTTMSRFTMCDQCKKEYDEPRNRRFHAQPNACPRCGPHVELWDEQGMIIASHHAAMEQAAQTIVNGGIVAVKGLGGFLILCDATKNDVVRTLRNRKHREEKPFAVMVPSIELAEKECSVSEMERRLLLSPHAPIVLLKKRRDQHSIISSSVALNNPYLGVMLPYTPLHHLIMSLVNIPVVATSGNISDEPICYRDETVLNKLGGIADRFLVHNRPIERYCDDSIVRVVQGGELMVRRARGYAPLPIRLPQKLGRCVLAVGAQLKNTIAVAQDDSIVISQYIGDLESAESLASFRKTINDIHVLYNIVPTVIVRDLHPGYTSTTVAQEELSIRYPEAKIIPLQHHFAHIASCMAENELIGTTVGFAWDGTGYGVDRTIWGGETILYENGKFRRVGTIRSFKLPGGDSAVREPRRCAASILHEIYGDDCLQKSQIIESSFQERDRTVLCNMLMKNINSPWSTSMGRIFDAVAAFCNVRMKNSFEGQAAMELEYLASDSDERAEYPISFEEYHGLVTWNWHPMFDALLKDIEKGKKNNEIAKTFHNTLAQVVVQMANRWKIPNVVLSGGCFQNMILLEQTITLLRKNGFTPYWHQRIPANDGGISLGQIYSVFLATHQHIQQERFSCVSQFRAE
ncbi:MAG: carbamoyltransferase HypF [Bacteriovoracaceae bacterium]